MASHPRDNDKKPRPRQDDSRDGPRKPFAKAGPKGPPRAGDKPFARDGKPGPRAEEGPKRSERIAKAMARAGIASRREVERLIGLGKVAVNGKILDTPATLVTRDDVITVDGKAIGSAQATRVWRYHKPAGLLTSHTDPAGRPTVFDALPSGLPRVISVGRLDLNTEGLLLLTNDGELSRALELPQTELVRQYRARARGRVSQLQLDSLKDGVTVDGVRYGPIEATLDKTKDGEGHAPANLWISVSITEGKNREVRKVLEHLGLTVNRLIRTSYGPFQLGQLKPGEVEEVRRRVLRDQLGLDTKDDEDAAESTTKPRKVIVRRNKSRETPSEADLFGDRPGGRPGRGAKPAPRTGKTSTGKPSTGKPASAKAATADAKPAQGRTTGGKAMGSKAMGGRPAAGKPGPDGDRAKGGDKPLRTTRPAKPRPKPTRG